MPELTSRWRKRKSDIEWLFWMLWMPREEEQARICLELERDRVLVESNRKLIQIFEVKIKAKLDEIWGAGQEATTESDAQDVEERTQDIRDSLM
jgi:hypothetical protein